MRGAHYGSREDASTPQDQKPYYKRYRSFKPVVRTVASVVCVKMMGVAMHHLDDGAPSVGSLPGRPVASALTGGKRRKGTRGG